jgi:predicted transposase YbfD/YdcC
MDDSDAVVPAVAETVGFLAYFKDLPDPRQQGKVTYPLEEVLLLCLTATLAGAEHITEIALFGEKRIDLLRRLRPFTNGTPRHDHLGDILATLDADQFQRCFAAWVAARTGVPEGVIAIDGKTSRRSRGKGKAALHLVSAFAARQRLVLGQAKVADKSNEIVAIPKLLDLLQIEGAIVSIDAMGCQREIARKIIDKKANYILALKGNQGSLREDAERFADEQLARGFADTAVSRTQTVDGEHGRIETRTLTVMHDVDWLRQRHDWPGLTALAMVESVRETADKVEQERRFYITSAALTADHLAPAIRDHWSIENSLHWVMDMVFRDDESRVRNGNAPANLAAIRHMAQNLIRARKGKLSVKANRKAAAWDDSHLIGLLIA